MATTKKNTAKTTVKENTEIKDITVTEQTVEATAKVVEETVKETVAEAFKEAMKEVVKETIEESKPVIVEEEKKSFTDSDYILCRSVYSGGLNVTSQSGNLYRFKGYGSECEINYRDLVTMIRRGSSHVFMPRFIILDEDFLAEFPTVQKVYGEMYTKDDLLEILDLPVSSMKAAVAKLPEATKNSLGKLVATQIANGRLDSIAKIRALTEIFNSDFNLLSELLK
jgi:DNA-binding protein YbaB